MKTKEKMIVLLALALSLVVSTQAFAIDDIEANGNDLVGAQTGGTSANDDSLAVGSDSLNGNRLNSNNDNSTDVDVKKSVDISNTFDLKKDSNNDNSTDVDVNKSIDVDASKTVDVNKTANQNGSENEADGKGNAAANNSSNATANNQKSANDSFNKSLEVEVEVKKDSNNDNSKTATDSFNKTVEVKEDSFNDNSKTATDSFNEDESQNVNAQKNALNESDHNIVTTDSLNGNTVDSNNKSLEIEIEDSEFAKDSYNGRLGEVEGGSVAATTGGTASMKNSNNDDHSVNNKAGDYGIVANDEAEIEANYDSNNKNEAEKGSAAVYGSGTATVNRSINGSYNESTEFEIGDVDVKVATSSLEGEVSGNSINTPPTDNTFKTGDNTIRADFSTTGISVLSQNTGVDSLVQQSVNVQINR